MVRRSAIVTGGSRGIGRAIALELAKKGMNVLVHYNENQNGAEETARRAMDLGVEATIACGDIADPSTSDILVDIALRSFGALHVVINNAGIYPRTSLDDLSIEEWRRVIEVNLSGPFYLSRASAPHLKRSGWGRIVNISSVIGHMGSYHGCHYAAAKAGLIGLTKSLALELGPEVTVNAVCPGMTMTDILSVYTEDDLRIRAERLPLKRIGRPEEIAEVVAFLVTEADYITGAVIDVNGGLYMR